jgi:hypothetical protein
VSRDGPQFDFEVGWSRVLRTSAQHVIVQIRVWRERKNGRSQARRELEVRRLGLALITVGLIALLVAVTLAEIASIQAEAYFDLAFYAGATMILVGAALIAVRVMWARRST